MRPEESCTSEDGVGGERLTLDPASPRGGQIVTATAKGLQPGREYDLSLTDGQSGGFFIFTSPSATADGDGRARFQFVMPDRPPNECELFMLWQAQPGGRISAIARFRYDRHEFAPAACESLTTVPTRGDDTNALLSVRNGTLLARFPAWSSFPNNGEFVSEGAFLLEVVYADRHRPKSTVLLRTTLRRDREAIVSTAALPPDPTNEGLCTYVSIVTDGPLYLGHVTYPVVPLP